MCCIVLPSHLSNMSERDTSPYQKTHLHIKYESDSLSYIHLSLMCHSCVTHVSLIRRVSHLSNTSVISNMSERDTSLSLLVCACVSLSTCVCLFVCACVSLTPTISNMSERDTSLETLLSLTPLSHSSLSLFSLTPLSHSSLSLLSLSPLTLSLSLSLLSLTPLSHFSLSLLETHLSPS